MTNTLSTLSLGDSHYDSVAETPTFCLFRDIHKGIRSELFALTELVGRTDPNDSRARTAVFDRVSTLHRFLEEHAEHEDKGIAPALELHLPQLAERMETDHTWLDQRLALAVEVAAAAADPAGNDRRRLLQRLYLDMASFTARYIPHQEMEERELMPQLEKAVGFDAVLDMHRFIIGSMPPHELAEGLALMLPAMNIEDQVDMIGPMLAEAEPEMIQGMLGLAANVLSPNDHTTLLNRLGLN